MTTVRMSVERAEELLSQLPRPAPLTAAQVNRIRANIEQRPHSNLARRLKLSGAFALLLLGTVLAARYLMGSDEVAVTPPVVAPDAQLESPTRPPPGPQPIVTAI